MDYEERNREFYQEIEKAKREIESLDISEEDRTNLYELVHETTQRHNKNMETLQRGITSSEELVKGQLELSQALQSISGKSKEVLGKLEGVVGVLEQKKEGKPLN